MADHSAHAHQDDDRRAESDLESERREDSLDDSPGATIDDPVVAEPNEPG
jgi:hypothetical protein